jgi:ketosteroid isomerase-like protein
VSRRDYEVMLAGAHPDFDGALPPEFPEQMAPGRDGLERWWRTFDEVADSWRVEPEEITESGDHVLVLTRWSLHSRLGGIELVDQPSADLHTFRDGWWVGLHGYMDRDQASEAFRSG